MIEQGDLRAVLDTNVFIAAALAKNPSSPTVELLQRWRRGQFVLLFADDLIGEVAEKLRAKNLSGPRVWGILSDVRDLGAHVPLTLGDVKPVIPADPDDDVVLACAVVGQATHLVTYDAHFAVLGGSYQGIQIVDALQFLHLLRQQTDSM